LHTHGILICGFETEGIEHNCKYEPKLDGGGINTAPI
jgi:hypothetical protein